MKIYEIDNEIMKCVDMETGEIIDAEKLEALEISRDKKIQNVALWIKELTAECSAIASEEEMLEKRRKIKENKIASLTAFLTFVLNGEEKEFPNVQIKYRSSTACEITDKSKIPPEFIGEEKVTPGAPMKKEITKALKQGLLIEGAELVHKTKLVVE